VAELICVDKTDKNWLTTLQGPKPHFRLIVCSHSSTNPANLATIGPVDVETIGLAQIVKNKYKNKQQRQNVSPPSAAAGWAN